MSPAWSPYASLILVAAACAVIEGCGSSTDSSDPGGLELQDAGPDPACMDYCRSSKSLSCNGPDTECCGTPTITSTSATGCSVEVTGLPVTGPLAMTIDCVAKKVCVDRAGPNARVCLGAAGMCYTAHFESGGFSSDPSPNCMQGGLSCY
jgi:hypothetical protein